MADFETSITILWIFIGTLVIFRDYYQRFFPIGIYLPLSVKIYIVLPGVHLKISSKTVPL